MMVIKGFKDTFKGMGVKNFLDIAKELGFEEEQEMSKELATAKIFSHEKGLVLTSNYDKGSCLEFARIYGEIKINQDLKWQQINFLDDCSHKGFGQGKAKGCLPFNLGVTKDFVKKYNELVDNFEMNSNWKEKQFLWFCDDDSLKNKGSESFRKIIG